MRQLKLNDIKKIQGKSSLHLKIFKEQSVKPGSTTVQSPNPADWNSYVTSVVQKPKSRGRNLYKQQIRRLRRVFS